MTATVAISGGTGFVGRHCVEALRRRGLTLDLLTRSDTRAGQGSPSPGLRYVQGDLTNEGDAVCWPPHGSPWLQLVHPHLPRLSDYETFARGLLRRAREHEVPRLLHLSSAAVYGACGERRVSETTACHPRGHYERSKLLVERTLLAEAHDDVEVIVLRPTLIVGTGGLNLAALATAIARGDSTKLRLRRWLTGNREIALVPVENVVAAIECLLLAPGPIGSRALILSDHDQPARWLDVERAFFHALHGEHGPHGTGAVPAWLLSALLFVLGKTHWRADQRFCTDALHAFGYEPRITRDEALANLARSVALPEAAATATRRVAA